MDNRPPSPARRGVAIALAVLAGVGWIAAALAPWYTSTRVDQDPDTVTGIGIALLPHLLAIGPLLLAAGAARRPRPRPWWTALVALLLGLPGLFVGLSVPGFVEASTTDTTVVREVGVWVLGAAVLLATASLAVSPRPRPDPA